MDTKTVQVSEDVAVAASGLSKGALVAPASSALNTTTSTSVVSLSGDDLPYPAEKYAGKLCALCNLGERSQLGQGAMLKISMNEESMDVPERMVVENSAPSEPNSSFEDSDSAVVLSHKRQKSSNKLKCVFYIVFFLITVSLSSKGISSVYN